MRAPPPLGDQRPGARNSSTTQGEAGQWDAISPPLSSGGQSYSLTTDCTWLGSHTPHRKPYQRSGLKRPPASCLRRHHAAAGWRPSARIFHPDQPAPRPPHASPAASGWSNCRQTARATPPSRNASHCQPLQIGQCTRPHSCIIMIHTTERWSRRPWDHLQPQAAIPSGVSQPLFPSRLAPRRLAPPQAGPNAAPPPSLPKFHTFLSPQEFFPEIHTYDGSSQTYIWQFLYVLNNGYSIQTAHSQVASLAAKPWHPHQRDTISMKSRLVRLAGLCCGPAAAAAGSRVGKNDSFFASAFIDTLID